MYEPFYKLTEKPFQLTPAPEFFFDSHSHANALACLRYGLHQGEGFIVISGKAGTGKTTLARLLIRETAAQEIACAELVSTRLSPQQALTGVVSAFGLKQRPENKAVALKQLETYFGDLARQGRRALLVIDEAQNLPLETIEELRMLTNFQHNGRPVLQIFLLGQERLPLLLQDECLEQFKQRIIAAHHLEPLDAEETHAYISHRLTKAGWRDDPQFSDAAFESIHALTDGIPRRINSLCDRLLLNGFLEELHRFDTAEVEEIGRELSAETDMLSEPSIAEPATQPATEAPRSLEERVSELEQRLRRIEERLDSEQITP